jgi:hypothetical protein
LREYPSRDRLQRLSVRLSPYSLAHIDWHKRNATSEVARRRQSSSRSPCSYRLAFPRRPAISSPTIQALSRNVVAFASPLEVYVCSLTIKLNGRLFRYRKLSCKNYLSVPSEGPYPVQVGFPSRECPGGTIRSESPCRGPSPRRLVDPPCHRVELRALQVAALGPRDLVRVIVRPFLRPVTMSSR